MNKMFLIDYKWIPFVFIVTCTIFFFFFLLAMGGPLCLFTLALWGYWVALLPRALYSRLARFAHTRFAYMKIFKRKKCVSIDSKRSETHSNAKKSLPLWPITRFARSAKPERQSATLPTTMSPLGSQGVYMPSFMPIGPKLWSGEGFL